MNNYFVLDLETGRTTGPVSFKKALSIWESDNRFGIRAIITKTVVDVNGKEVK